MYLKDVVQKILIAGVRQHIFPGAVAAYWSQEECFTVACGHTTYEENAPPMEATFVFDVASVTKAIATTTAVLQLASSRELALDEYAYRYVPELRSGRKSLTTIRQLLSHTAGYPVVELHTRCRTRSDLLSAILQVDPTYNPGTGRIYDDIGFIILGLIVERVSGKRLDAYCDERIFRPLGMADTSFCPPSELLPRVVPTEVRPQESEPVHGVVHDEQAYLLSGVAGHAGVFSTAGDLLMFGTSVLASYAGASVDALPQNLVTNLFVTEWEDEHGRYGMGWDHWNDLYLRSHSAKDIIAHTGFTGVSIVIDATDNKIVILLSNRIYPKRSPRESVDQVRRALHEVTLG